MQKQKIDAQYLKLIGVTLMMTAVCVTDSGHQRALIFADESVREVIPEQFRFLSPGQLAEVIEWGNAITQAAGVHPEQSLSVKYIYFELLPVNKALRLLPGGVCGTRGEGYNAECYHLSYRGFGTEKEWRNSTVNRNKHSLITRAGPAA